MGLYNYTELIEKALNKEQEAFVELYNSSCDLSFYIARQICNNSEDALDIVQNSYVKAFSNLDKLKKPESFPNWLARVVTNQTKDYLKKNYKVKFESFDISTELEDIDYRYNNYYGDIQPEQVVDKEETKKMIQEILDTLPIEQRMVTIMYYFEEMTTREIAVNLSCNENTVKSRLVYAKKQIEKSVLHFEKQGTKLYGLLPIPFFSWLLTQGVEAYRLPSYITEEVLHNVISSVMGGGLLEMVKINLSHIFKPLYAKVIAGALTGTLVIGGSYFIYLGNKTPTENYNQIAYAEVTEDESIEDSKRIENNESIENSEAIVSSTDTEESGNNNTEASSALTDPPETTLSTQQVGTIAPIATDNFVGEWHRTNTYKAYSGTITITNQTDTSFDFSFYGIYGANSGSINGTAVITDKNTAEFQYTPEYNKIIYAKVDFVVADNNLQVKLTDGSKEALGFGNNVSIDGEYTTTDPTYIDTDIINEVLPNDELKEKVCTLLGQDVYDQMVFVIENGVRYQMDGLTYSGFISGAGQGVDLLIKDDKIYCLGYGLDADGPVYKLYTNDNAYQDRLPPFMHIDRSDYKLEFVYKP